MEVSKAPTLLSLSATRQSVVSEGMSIVQQSLGHWTLSNKVLDMKDHAVGQEREEH